MPRGHGAGRIHHPPTSGWIEVHGRVSTLLSLGVGFTAALSEREIVILVAWPWG
ncbi:ABC-type polysaccharide/polyol phosphate transport system ATPase subunit [Kribbella aluminosa]|uniref:ABC-type polysaccharide/polyol phosphate transport system ATPase subunit n=1 Tax=Kribbella aluminosa TaxID=416017 RepID=A0ABS4UBK2_9ACTN|nr:hypothetical protein [Kribbella aluminosa]MBP2348975.1 ABC-type polysaccharide/polyol phosphate transport system ATPase subunit [Kribbella aluminosa]